ncbi:N-acetylmuramoyl-L-alanine amidase [Algirhabdus cladophorae]|uniref:N-acetylmuramoyl-L-alanine amidase n=1 Tax=Algirhabdus cladophorae TaxID=3377108 RepID=UPI003B848D16
MIRGLMVAVLGLWMISVAGTAQQLQGLARVDPAQSMVVDAADGGVELRLYLSQGVPFRTFTVKDPQRFIVEFQEAHWDGVTPDALLNSDRIAAVRFGRMRPGWSRLVLDLTQPMAVELADMQIDPGTGTALVRIALAPTSLAAFEATAIASPPLPDAVEMPAWPELRVVLDPGHGGIDPGAAADGLKEADLMLSFARELRDVLRALDIEVTLTRTEDVFVSLRDRIAIAHRAEADVFVSLHADTIAEGNARGATVYTLSEEASDRASAELAAQLDRADLLVGVDLAGTDDAIAQTLMELARLETGPRSQALAEAVVGGLKNGVGRINSRPLRQAGFSVLRAPDIPSILLELGFLSDGRDLSDLRDPAWRANAARAVAEGIQLWAMEDAETKALLRQ